MAGKEYITTIGLEVHVELKTDSKMFCSCKNDPDNLSPNSNICPICMGHPGTLPVINQDAVLSVIKAGLAMNCEVSVKSKFDRKNYFYPDLPKGYQISQYDLPLCKNGYLMINGERIRIKRIHLEEDTAKLIHASKETLIDYNRAGVPLMELVTEPDINNPENIKYFAQELQNILRYLMISNADMEKGQMRVEVNISVSDNDILGNKVEIKNIGTISGAVDSANYEIKRQIEALEKGQKIIQETRGWDGIKKQTFSQRIKEGEADYRYFPEPDLPILDLSIFDIQKMKQDLPELPRQKRERFIREYGMSEKEAQVFVNDRQISEYFEKIVSELLSWSKDKNLENDFQKLTKLAVNYLLSDFKGLLAKNSFKDDQEYPITPENFAELITLIYSPESPVTSSQSAKMILVKMFYEKKDPSHIVDDLGLKNQFNEDQIFELAEKIIKNNPKAVADYKSGQENAAMFLVGQLMKEMQGRVRPDVATQAIVKALKES
ncbi:MAG TPA: Asp-tRNA(Asn)/Glu-tRNA(Gln) amidotransferase subunit GatB [Candidatus Pacearchaeota archaeon]|nr:Asp-tRNA(Asn)/Glu-tRNA(Gln) amidotransferase subunit GatB [Candidatus Parcubacteria bacterium]HOU45882.1 Asp-tRNA(Asn)/Glu-tRNA(Gln) amidotransferase subunit GatB [Candidatus Pacearchaeota archaeon]HQI74327.1 Asp-tRNA(Asn)/Glu-tRNA(Gln) amidotransferase subunit GatB [Candidatus Pacearchaeota archaeon]